MSDINKYPDGIILTYDEEALHFKTIAEFKDVINRGAEIVFKWKGIYYGAFGCFRDEETGEQIMIIAQCGSAEVNAATEKICHTADEVLDYMVGNDRLRNVITKVAVIDRTL